MSQSTAVKKNSFWTYFRLTWQMTTISILSAMEYRVSFWGKVIGMMVNDVGHIAIWIIYFKSFNSVNGWELRDMMLLFAVGMILFSVFAVLAEGTLYIARNITRGEMDYYLTLPKNPLWYMSVDRTEIAALGDLLFGIIIFFFSGYASWTNGLVLVLVATTASLIMYNFAVITQSMAFYLGNFEESAERWYWSLFGFAFYPQSVFYGPLKLVMFTLLPAMFIFSIPVELIRDFKFHNFAYMIGAWAVSFALATWIFKKGLKKYESGNLINIRI